MKTPTGQTDHELLMERSRKHELRAEGHAIRKDWRKCKEERNVAEHLRQIAARLQEEDGE